ncbi:MAG: diphthine synthase [Candidatus Pacearchaeota archaeon]
MLYIIGLGMDLNSITQEGLEAIKNSDKIYLESYTVDFPYSREELEEKLDTEIHDADRNIVESTEIPREAQDQNVALLVYGSPLAATTHISLIEECQNLSVSYEVIHNASIIDAIAETGLQLYKFGKTASMPKWKTSYKPESFIEIAKQNSQINAHTLILCDIGMPFHEAAEQLKESSKNHEFQIDSIIACQSLGTQNSKIAYGNPQSLKETEIQNPFCIILPAELHKTEKEFLENFSI